MSGFDVRYEGVPGAGLIFVPPSTDVYSALVKEIEARSLETAARYPGQAGFDVSEIDGWELPDQHDRSVVFINQGERPVALLQILWLFELLGGREIVGSCAWAGNEALLLPYGQTPSMRTAGAYWWSILPGSKRYIAHGSVVIGDNTDVRPPTDEEIWRGGFVMGFGGGGVSEPRQAVRLTISVTGAFFDNGDFAGTNRSRLFEQISAKAKARSEIAELASAGGKSAQSILDGIERKAKEFGALPEISLLPDESIPSAVYDKIAFREVADNIKGSRSAVGEQATVRNIRTWRDVVLPVFRKLDGHSAI
jgi:hypothetical protein